MTMEQFFFFFFGKNSRFIYSRVYKFCDVISNVHYNLDCRDEIYLLHYNIFKLTNLIWINTETDFHKLIVATRRILFYSLKNEENKNVFFFFI